MLSTYDPKAILADLDRCPENTLPAEIMTHILSREAEFAPLLLERLQKILEPVHENDLDEDNGFSHVILQAPYFFYAWKNKDIIPTLLEILKLPDEIPFHFWGDAAQMDMPFILGSLAAGRINLLVDVLNDDGVDQYFRSTIANSFIYLIVNGQLTKSEVESILIQTLKDAVLHPDEDDPLVEFLTLLICEIARYAPPEAYEFIKKAYQDYLVDTSLIRWEEVVGFYKNPELTYSKHLEEAKENQPVDIIEKLSSWPIYNEKVHYLQTSSLFEQNIKEYDDEDSDWDEIHDDDPEFVESFARHLHPGTIVNQKPRINRNDPCPCNSGKKYKKCCGKED